MGTGSGIVAIFLLLVKKANPNFSANIYASDIDQNAIDSAKANEKCNRFNNQITFIQSDLFKSFPADLKHRFDIIFFNPPYLPSIVSDRNLERNNSQDYTWDGGEKGFEVILDFLKQARNFLRKEHKTRIYYVCSSKTNLQKLYERISQLGFKNTILKKTHIFFEDLFLNRSEIVS
jgi:HemK-related putative methylase